MLAVMIAVVAAVLGSPGGRIEIPSRTQPGPSIQPARLRPRASRAIVGPMAQAKSKPEKSSGRGVGARTGLLAALLAVVAAAALWLSDCVPGFGIGGGKGEGEGEGTPAKQEPSEPVKTDEAKQPVLTAPAPMTIEIAVDGCKLGDGPKQTCAELCKRAEKGEFAGIEKVTLESEHGSQADVTLVIDCLTTAGVTKLAIQKG